MQVSMLGKTLFFRKEPNVSRRVLKAIEDEMSLNKLVINCLIIDGVAVYSDFESIINENLYIINEIIVESEAVDVFTIQNLKTAIAYLDRAIPSLEQLANQFYISTNGESWEQFEDFIAGFEWLLTSFASIQSISETLNFDIEINSWIQSIPAKQHRFKSILSALGEAVEHKDQVLIGDLLKYEVVDLYNELHNELIAVVPCEGDPYVSGE